ncbi:MAG: nucleotide sugar dehydrogenase [Candidatus Auribacterota bacterium]
MSTRKICVVGLGYVGLPLAVAFGNKQHIVGFDINSKRISALKAGADETHEVSDAELAASDIEFTDNPELIAHCDFIVVAVPTPVDHSKTPDLTAVRSATAIVGRNLSKGAIVVYESTVYPGVTEDICIPILEQESGLKHGVDFKVGYSPERINPGDKEHTIDKIVKVISGADGESLEVIAAVYGEIILAGIHRAPNIKTAEAAKVIENIQRDLNIALMNELAIIFEKVGIETRKVIEAACTKWNFNRYFPGLVGGHCIGVDPYYLTHLALHLGIHPKVILAGRDTNDGMSKYVAEKVLKELIKAGKAPKEAHVLVMGLTFKENVPDMRNSRAFDVIRILREYTINVTGCDPLLHYGTVEGEAVRVKNVPFDSILDGTVDCVLVINAHNVFKSITLDDLKRKMKTPPILVDLKSMFSKESALREGFSYNNL